MTTLDVVHASCDTGQIKTVNKLDVPTPDTHIKSNKIVLFSKVLLQDSAPITINDCYVLADYRLVFIINRSNHKEFLFSADSSITVYLLL